MPGIEVVGVTLFGMVEPEEQAAIVVRAWPKTDASFMSAVRGWVAKRSGEEGGLGAWQLGAATEAWVAGMSLGAASAALPLLEATTGALAGAVEDAVVNRAQNRIVLAAEATDEGATQHPTVWTDVGWLGGAPSTELLSGLDVRIGQPPRRKASFDPPEPFVAVHGAGREAFLVLAREHAADGLHLDWRPDGGSSVLVVEGHPRPAVPCRGLEDLLAAQHALATRWRTWPATLRARRAG